MPSTIATKIRLRRWGVSAVISAALDAGSGAPKPRLAVMAGSVPGLLRARRPGDALRQVQLGSQLVHQFQLRLEVVDVAFLVRDDLLQQEGAGAVLLLAAHDDARLEPLHHFVFD